MTARERGFLHQRPGWFGKLPAKLMHDLCISEGAKVLYAHMHWRYGSNRRNFESMASMARMLGVSRVTIQKRVAELERANWIVVQRRSKRRGQYQSNFYHVFETQEDCIAWKTHLKADDVVEKTGRVKQALHGHVKPALHGHVKPALHYLDPDHLDSITTCALVETSARVEGPPQVRDEALVLQSLDASVVKTPRRARAKDELYEAVCEHIYEQPYQVATKRTRSLARAVTAEIRAREQSGEQVSIEDVQMLKQRYKQTNPNLVFPTDPTKIAAWLFRLRQLKSEAEQQELHIVRADPFDVDPPDSPELVK